MAKNLEMGAVELHWGPIGKSLKILLIKNLYAWKNKIVTELLLNRKCMGCLSGRLGKTFLAWRLDSPKNSQKAWLDYPEMTCKSISAHEYAQKDVKSMKVQVVEGFYQ